MSSLSSVSSKKICLVQPPLLCNEKMDLLPPLGLLTLAAVLRNDGHQVRIVDLNLLTMKNKQFAEEYEFYSKATDLVMKNDPEYVGFTSMAIESHVSLRLAKCAKKINVNVKTILGGSHFSAIALEVLDRFEWIDYVVCGEAEKALSQLLRKNEKSKSLVKNVAERTVFGSQVQRDSTDKYKLDDSPFPAYDLIDLQAYYNLNTSYRLPYEHARGCNLRCSFCYSPGHWGQGEDAKSSDLVVAEMQRLKKLGARNLFFVGDNFLNNKSKAIELARFISSADIGLHWQCYATLAQLTPEVIDALANAKCNGVFIGIDAVTVETKKSFKKSFFKDWGVLKAKLENCIDRGIVPTCALMLSPDMQREEKESVFRLALNIFSIGGFVRLNHLSIYNGTGQFSTYSKSAIHYSDFQVLNITDSPVMNKSNEYAKLYPDLFPFHNRYTDIDAERDIVLLNKIGFVLIQLFQRTLLRFVFQHDGSILDVIAYCQGLYKIDHERKLDQEHEYLSSLIGSCPSIITKSDLLLILHFEKTQNYNRNKVYRNHFVLNKKNNRRYTLLPVTDFELPCNPSLLRQTSVLANYGEISKYFVPAVGRDSNWFDSTDKIVEKISELEAYGETALSVNEEMRLQVNKVICL